MSLIYKELSADVQKQIILDRENHWENPWKCKDNQVMRRDNSRDKANLWRPSFVRDIEKILHLPFYNRYTDKTQVFSFYHNDDLSRRALHVQLVSRIARNIGSVLGLNLDLIEAIALGHDIGHTPFGHAGEHILNEILLEKAGIHFNHNVQSARVLDVLFHRNISLQTLDGVLCHNGEFEQQEYKPLSSLTFSQHDERMEKCIQNGNPSIKELIPYTLEGCVVRISDMIAYLGKDRQDARIAHVIDDSVKFTSEVIGTENAAIINNLVVDIIENSYRKPYLLLSPEVYHDLKTAKDENYRLIYKQEGVNEPYNAQIKPMFRELFEKLLLDIQNSRKNSVIYTHHISYISDQQRFYSSGNYEEENPYMIVADFMASMTDDYFMALHRELFPKSTHQIEFHNYF